MNQAFTLVQHILVGVKTTRMLHDTEKITALYWNKLKRFEKQRATPNFSYLETNIISKEVE